MNSVNQKDISDQILKLEQKLLKPEIRTSYEKLSELLADEFVEFAGTGVVYNKKDIINALQINPGEPMSISDFELRALSDKVMMATYRTICKSKPRFALRCSIWIFEGNRWQMSFHQATPQRV